MLFCAQQMDDESWTGTRSNKMKRKIVNLALLLDAKKVKRSQSAKQDVWLQPTDATTAQNLNNESGFTASGLPILEHLPERFNSATEVRRWCDIPPCLKDVEPTTLLKRHGASLFPGVTFLEKPHEYWLSENVYTRLIGTPSGTENQQWNAHKFSGSVTTVASRCFSPFDAKKAIASILGSKNYNKPDYDYYQMTDCQISNQWLAANLLGTLLHFFIELDCNGMASVIPNSMKEKTWRQYLQFKSDFISNKYVPYLTELRVYDLDYDLAGSIDAVFVRREEYVQAKTENRPPKIVLIDWKRTKTLSDRSFTGEMAAPPLQAFPDANFFKYSMQLNIYKHLIEKNTKYTVEAMYLCRFHPRLAEGEYDLRPVAVYEKEVTDLLQLRKAEMTLSTRNQ